MVTQDQMVDLVDKNWQTLEYLAWRYSSGRPWLQDELLSQGLNGIVEKFHKNKDTMPNITKAWVCQAFKWAVLSHLRKMNRRQEIESERLYLDSTDDAFEPTIVAEQGSSGTASLLGESSRVADPEALCISKQRVRDLNNAIEDLPDYCRHVAYFILVYDYSYKETAEKLDIKIGTVMSRLHRARGFLQEWLADYDYTDELFRR